MGRKAVLSIAAVLVLTGLPFGLYGLYLQYDPDRTAYPVWGLDLSHHQGAIDWDRLAATSPDFVFMKATEGGDFKDSAFQHNWREAGRVGLRRGAYHFFTPCRTGGIQARNFIAAVPRDPAALPPVVDLEFRDRVGCQPSRSDVLKELMAFLDSVERHYGTQAIIYTTEEFYGRYLQGAVESRDYWLRSLVFEPDYRDAGWTFWQYHNLARISGIDGPVDKNVFNGDRAALARLGQHRVTP